MNRPTAYRPSPQTSLFAPATVPILQPDLFGAPDVVLEEIANPADPFVAGTWSADATEQDEPTANLFDAWQEA